MNMSYSASIFWSDEDNGFIALIPEFPGLSAFGETREEAAREVEIALQGMLELCEKEGDSIPAPQHLPEHSGQLRIRIPKTLHTHLALLAEKEGVSLNSCISNILSEAVGHKKSENAFTKDVDFLYDKFQSVVQSFNSLCIHCSANSIPQNPLMLSPVFSVPTEIPYIGGIQWQK